MSRLWLIMMIVVFPTLVCGADAPVIQISSPSSIPQNLLKHKQTSLLKASDGVEIRYGASSVYFHLGPEFVDQIDHRRSNHTNGLLSFEKTAEAFGLPAGVTIPALETLCHSINRSSELSQLKEIVSPSYYRSLQEKVDAGISQYVVLAMLQAMRPVTIHIQDFIFYENQAELAVKGVSFFGPLKGKIKLVKAHKGWRIDQELWHAGSRDWPERNASLSAADFARNYRKTVTSGLLTQVSPDSMVNRNYLSLSKVPYHKSRRAFNFVFVVKKADRHQSGSKQVYDRDRFDKKLPTHMHVLWTGSKKILPQQKVADSSYPIDFSIANFDDGYSPGQWNLILPNKKPREIVVSVLVNF